MKIANLIHTCPKPFFSLEFFPPSNADDLPAFYDTVEQLKTVKPLFASVTYGAGGAKQASTLAVTAELVKREVETMAHLTCVGAEPEGIAAFLESLQQAGVYNVLALRGDPPKDGHWDWSKGNFRHASDLVRFVRQRAPQMGIAVAAYPTPHPQSRSITEDRFFTAQKLRSGAHFAITQLFFDVREYVALVDTLRDQGVRAPIIPGIMPIRSFASLKRILSLSDTSIPGKLYLALEEADRKGGAEAVREAGLAFAISQIRQVLDAGAPGVHLYTLNKADLCVQIVKESGLLRAGNS